MIQKLEDHVFSQKSKRPPVIDFEKNENLKGLEHLDVIYQAIINNRAISLTYQSFRARFPNCFNFHPYLLKEFRNRWFVIGAKKKDNIFLNLALDRIISIGKCDETYIPRGDFNAAEYFKDTIGVSVSRNLPAQKVFLFITHKHAPYVLTKPFHPSQQLVEKDHYGVTISLDIQHNFELEKEILGFGDGIKVIAPLQLKRVIKERLRGGLDLYNTEINDAGLSTAIKGLKHKGFSILNNVFTQREIKKMRQELEQHFNSTTEEAFGKRTLLKDIKTLKPIIFNSNIKKIINAIEANAFLCKAVYFDKPPGANWFVSWHQDITINVTDKKEMDDYSSWTFKHEINSVCPPEAVLKNIFSMRIHLDDTTVKNGALKVVPGTHKKRLSDEEIKTITANIVPFDCEIPAGGIQLLSPLLLHASSRSLNQRKRRVIHLEFTSVELPEGMEWLEREEII